MTQPINHRKSRLPDHLPDSTQIRDRPTVHSNREKNDRAAPYPKGKAADGVRKRPSGHRNVGPSNRLQKFILKVQSAEQAENSVPAVEKNQATPVSSPWQIFERVFDIKLSRKHDVTVALRKDLPRDMVLLRKVTVKDHGHAQKLLGDTHKFNHKNLVRFVEPYGFSISADSFYFIMEFCEGSINDFVNCAAWPWECHIATIIKQASDTQLQELRSSQ